MALPIPGGAAYAEPVFTHWKWFISVSAFNSCFIHVVYIFIYVFMLTSLKHNWQSVVPVTS